VVHVGHIFHRGLLVGLPGWHIHARHIGMLCAHCLGLRFLSGSGGNGGRNRGPMIRNGGQQDANHEQRCQADSGSVYKMDQRAPRRHFVSLLARFFISLSDDTRRPGDIFLSI
jgi:hypothetical protein